MGLKDIAKLLSEYPIHLSTFKKSNLLKKTRWIKRLLRCYLFIVKLLPKYPFHIFVNRYVKYINKVVALNNIEFNNINYQPFKEGNICYNNNSNICRCIEEI